MQLPKLTETTDILLTLFGLTFVVLGWFLLVLTLSHLFLFPLVALGFALLLALAFITAWRLFLLSPVDFRVVLLLALAYALLIAFVAEPTIFSGRDQGSIAEAAYRLAANTELAFSTPASNSFFQIYGPGTALNFPGFAYTKEGYLLTQFPLGYTAWLAGFVALFGMAGFVLANAVLLFLFLIFFYRLLRLFVEPLYAQSGLLLALTSFLPAWFAKFTLTENLAAFLFVFLVYQLVLFFRQPNRFAYFSLLLTGGLFAFTRIEGFAFLGITLVILFFSRSARSLWRTSFWHTVLLPASVFLFIFLRDFFLNLPYYKMIGKAALKIWQHSSESTPLNQVPTLGLGSVFLLYGFLPVALLGFLGIFLVLRRKQWPLLIPALLALPTAFYLFVPSITPDLPWMLRRYVFSLFPTLVFYTVIGIALFFAPHHKLPLTLPRGKKLLLVWAIFFGLVLCQLPAWNSQLLFAENRGLRAEVANFANNFSDHDLILVDSQVTGDGFAMLTGSAQFLYHKNTVYFFNPYDLAALDLTPFTHVYLITPEESQGRYTSVFSDRLTRTGSFTFDVEHYDDPLTLGVFRLPQPEIIQTSNTIFQIK